MIFQNGNLTYNGTLVRLIPLMHLNNVLAANSSMSNHFSGEIVEVLLYSKALSSGERASVESYLLQKCQPSQFAPEAPIISVASTSLDRPTQVAITAKPSSVIHLTTEGTDPTSMSPIYTGPINVTYSQTLTAIAVQNGLSSAVASESYILNQTLWPSPTGADSTPLDINLQLPTNAIPQ